MIDYHGRQFFTGNNPPESKTLAVVRYSTRLNRSAIESVLNDANRLPPEKEFDSSWIYDQESLSSCNGVAAAKSLERAIVRSGQSEKVKLSAEFVYAGVNGGVDQGSHLNDGAKFLVETGAAKWQPRHRGKYRKRDFQSSDYDTAKNHKAFEIYGVDTEIELAEGLALGFVAIVAVHAGNDFMRLDADKVPGVVNGPGNHAVLIENCKIEEGRILFLMANSWGVNWGHEGKAWLTWKHLEQPAKYHWFYLIRCPEVKTEIPNLQRS